MGVLLLALTATALAHRPASPAAGQAARIGEALDRMTSITRRRVQPPASSLSLSLPSEAARLERLREPAATVEDQLGLALAELERMTAHAYDPHYLPAVIAVGRAFLAATGEDPLTRTQISPEYAGLVPEMAAGASKLGRSAAAARRVSAAAARLARALARSRRHARQLARRLQRARDGAGAPGR
jgi:hypothetical protein